MKAVIFDMDGVVVDSERHWGAIEEAEIFAEAVGPDRLSASEIAGMNVSDVYAYLDEKFGTKVTESAFVDLYDEAAEEVYTRRAALMDGFEAVVEDARRRGQAVALASSSPRRWIDLALERHDLHDAFALVVSAEDIDGASKPAPDIYRHTADLLGVEPDECIAVEDSKHGVDAAKGAGTYCIGYRTAANRNQDLSRADVIVEGPGELADQLERRA